MVHYDRDDLVIAIESLDDFISRSIGTLTKFKPGTSQYTLLDNRIQSLKYARTSIENILHHICTDFESHNVDTITVPLQSLLAKAEKTITNLNPSTWQHQRMQSYIDALTIALSILIIEIPNEINQYEDDIVK